MKFLRFNIKNKYLIYSAILIAIVVIVIAVFSNRVSSDLPSVEVKKGDFLIELTTTGEVKAAQSISVSAPRIQTNLQIVKLLPEGEVVKKGDFLIQFDTNELQKIIDSKQSELEIAQANLEKTKASLDANLAQLDASLESERASFELSKLRLNQMAFESTIKVQEESLRLKQSEISLRQAEARIEAQKKMDSADVTALELKIKQAQADLDKALEQLTQMTVKAPAPGLVVYQKIWTGSSIEKIKVGDTPWRGQNLIELPDLSKMQVATEISEVEIGKLEKGQTVTVKLDAFPDPTFYGQVSDIASLAREKEGESDLKVFDVLIDLEKPDKLLKPGMTAKATILVEKIPDQIFIPIEAVFEKEGRKIAYIIDGSVKPINLELGKRNDNFVIVLNGLKAGQIVSLVDPLRPRETMSEDTKAKSISVPD